MDIVSFILEYGVLILSIICAIVSIIIAIVKAAKNGNIKGVVKLLQYIPDLVRKAEELFGKGNGKAKFTYVYTELKIMALQNNVKFDENLFAAQIEDVVATTKSVNVETTPTSAENDKNSGVGSSIENNAVIVEDNVNI